MTYDEYTKEIERRYRELRRQKWQGVIDVAGGILIGIGIVAVFCLYCLATPNQRSAECEMQYHLAEQARRAAK